MANDPDFIGDAEWLTGLIQQTEQELPPPKPRKKKKSQG